MDVSCAEVRISFILETPKKKKKKKKLCQIASTSKSFYVYGCLFHLLLDASRVCLFREKKYSTKYSLRN